MEDFGQAGANSVKEWHEQLYSVDVGAITHMLQLEFNYLDRKWILQGDTAGPLDMEFESKTENYFMVCGPPGHDQHCNATNTKWTIDGEGIGCKFKEQSQKDGASLLSLSISNGFKRVMHRRHFSRITRTTPTRRDALRGAALRYLGPEDTRGKAQAGAAQAQWGGPSRD